MERRLFVVFCLGYCVIPSSGIQNRYVTQMCPGSVGPTHGEVVRFDPSYNSSQWAIPEVDIDCWLTLRGMPATDLTVPWYVSLNWRNEFYVEGWDYANTGCETAYLEIYYASVDGKPQGTPAIGPLCGDQRPSELITANQAIVLHVYAERTPEIPTVPPQPTVAPAATVTQASGITVAVTLTAVTSSSNNVTVTPTSGGPYIRFRAEFTSYFLDCDSDGVTNNGDQLQCLTDRCIDTSLRCDRYSADNCGDLGDESTSPPGNCTVIPTDTDDEPDLLPLWIVLGLLGFLLLLYWFCWRPGCCPWRLARLRNTSCCRAVCKSCRGARGCRNGTCGPAEGCYTNCARKGARTGSGYPEQTPADDMTLEDANNRFNWLTFAHNDGMHLREMR